MSSHTHPQLIPVYKSESHKCIMGNVGMLNQLFGDEGGVGHGCLWPVTFTEGSTAGPQGIQVQTLLLTQVNTWTGKPISIKYRYCDYMTTIFHGKETEFVIAHRGIRG